MVTISLKLPNDLARRVLPLEDRLPEIIELGLQQMTMAEEADTPVRAAKLRAIAALSSTGLIIVPEQAATNRERRSRRTPIEAGGTPASEMIIAERS